MAKGVINVVIAGDAKLLEKELRKAERSMKRFGNTLKSAGDSIFRTVGVPFLAAGAAGVKAASDFESSMSKIKGLVGVAGEDLKQLEEAAMRLGPQMGKSAGEAADAMFFITSAGIKGKEAIDILEMSLKASAAGLGETKVIADLATSSMNAYGVENLSAAKATDILTATVREGKLEATSLAGAMGQVLPITSAMGVQMNEVGAAFAAMSRTGTGAEEAATQLKGILASMLKPTTEAEEALKKMGLSSEMLRRNIKEKGLLDTLNLLNTKFAGNTAVTAQVFGNVRALTGVMDLMGKNAQGTTEIFTRMNEVAGDTDKAFQAASETTEFKFNQALSQLNAAGIKLGRDLIPVVTTIVDKIQGAVAWFQGLSDSTRKTLVNFGLFVTAASAGVSVLGRLVIAGSAVVKTLRLMGAASLLTGKGFARMWKRFLLPVGAVIAALEGLIYLYENNIPKAFRNDSVNSAIKGYQNLKKAFGEITGLTSNVADETDELNDQYKESAVNTSDLTNLTKGLSDSYDDTTNSQNKLATAQEKAAAKAALIKSRMQELVKTLRTYNDHLKPPEEKPMISGVDGGTDFAGLPIDAIIPKIENVNSTIQTMGETFDRVVQGWADKIVEFGEKYAGVISGIKDTVGAFFEYKNSKLEQDYQKELDLLSARLGDEESFNEAKARLDERYDKKRRKIQRQQAMAQKALALMDIALNTAVAVTKVLGQTGLLGIPLSGIVIGLGAAQAALVAATPVPKLAEGGMTTGPGLAQIGDNPSGKEFVIPFEKMGQFARQAIGDTGINLSGEFRVRGTDLVLSLERTNRQITGARGYGLNN